MSPIAEDYLLLLEEVKRGSKEAFDLLFEKYYPLVFGIACKMMKNKFEAEDVCQEVLLDFFQRPYLYQAERGSLEAFLAVKTKHKCLDVLRKQERQAYMDPMVTNKFIEKREAWGAGSSRYANPPVEYVLMKERREVVQEALQQIPEAQRLAVQGAYLEEVTQRNLAERMNKPLGTVKSLIRYGLRNMRKHLSKYSGGSSGGEERD